MYKGEVYMYRIAIQEAKIGMVLAEPVIDLGGKKLLVKEGQVLNQNIIKKLEEWEVQLISVADIYSLQIHPIDKMQVTLRDAYTAVISQYASMQLAGNKRDDIPAIVKKMDGIIENICANTKILNYCLEMRMVRERNLFDKAVSTSVFAGLMAGASGCRAEQMQDIMIGGLLHDSGCLEMTFLIGRKERNTQEELLWREHPTYGYYFAIQNELSREIAEMIQYHEEHYDGSGYPKQLKGEEIPLGARIVAICSNITENIVYHGMKLYEALEVIYGTSGMLFDAKLVNLFVGSVALYPMGALVRLSTGEVGVITNIRKNYGERPIVSVYYNSVNRPLSAPKIVDLGIQRTIFIEEVLG